VSVVDVASAAAAMLLWLQLIGSWRVALQLLGVVTMVVARVDV